MPWPLKKSSSDGNDGTYANYTIYYDKTSFNLRQEWQYKAMDMFGIFWDKDYLIFCKKLKIR